MDPSIYSAPKVDCHCHVLDPARFAYAPQVAYRPQGQEIGSADYFSQLLDAYGVRHALLVGPNSGYGSDNRCLLDAIRRSRGRFKGVAVVALDTPSSQLAELRAQGIVGIAFNFSLHGLDYYDGLNPLLDRIAAQDMLVQVQVQADQLAKLSPMLLGCGARLLVDHCGRPDLVRGLRQSGFKALLSLSASQRATVKLSGFAKFSGQEFPFSDTLPYTHALLQAFGPDHCVWASDWPFLKAQRRLDYGPLLQLMAQIIPDAQDRHKVFYSTAMRLFGFAGAANDGT